jgi:hypothetical protein
MSIHNIVIWSLQRWGVPFEMKNWPANAHKRKATGKYDYVIEKEVFEPEWFDAGYGKIRIVITPYVEEVKLMIRTYFKEPYSKMSRKWAKCGPKELLVDLHDPRSLILFRMEVDRWDYKEDETP